MTLREDATPNTAVATLPTPAGPASYVGESLWSQLPRQAPAPLFSEDEILTMSPSSLSTFIQCPRRFFYQSRLYLPSETSEGASMGILVHGLMEIFNSAFEPTNHTLERLLGITETLFSATSLEEFLQAEPLPESQTKPLADMLDRLGQMDPLSRFELQSRIVSAFQDLERKGYFAQPVQAVRAEQTFSFPLPNFPRCHLKGRMDTLLQRQDGTWEIVDYKFYGPNQFNLKDPNNPKLTERLLSALKPLPEGNLSHKERFKTSPSAPRDAQLPIYFLATQEAEALQDIRGSVSAVALQIIRPPFPENPAQGSIGISIPSDQLEAGLEQWQADFKAYVAQAILESTHLAPNPGQQCRSCTFLAICEGQVAEEDEALSTEEEG